MWQFLWIGHSCDSFSRFAIRVAVSLDWPFLWQFL
jgi:hypothetical protein